MMRQRRTTIERAIKRKAVLPSRRVWKGGLSVFLISVGCWSLSRLSLLEEITILDAQPQAAQPPAMSPLLPSEYPEGINSLIINIGSNRDPILPKDSCSFSLAFEPMVPDAIKSHPQLIVIPAAVVPNQTSDTVTMYDVNKRSISSSLKAPSKDSWLKSKDKGTRQVPAISLTALLQQLQLPIRFLQTDIQGMDLEVVSSALDLLAEKVPLLRTEVWLEGRYSYDNVQNDFCDWLPRMMQAGYELVEVRQYTTARPGYENQTQALQTCQSLADNPRRPGIKEGDALWKWKRLETPVSPDDFEYPKSKKAAAQLELTMGTRTCQ